MELIVALGERLHEGVANLLTKQGLAQQGAVLAGQRLALELRFELLEVYLQGALRANRQKDTGGALLHHDGPTVTGFPLNSDLERTHGRPTTEALGKTSAAPESGSSF